MCHCPQFLTEGLAEGNHGIEGLLAEQGVREDFLRLFLLFVLPIAWRGPSVCGGGPQQQAGHVAADVSGEK